VLGGIRERGYFDSLSKTGFVSIRYDVLDRLPSVEVAYRTDSGVELKLSGSNLRKAQIQNCKDLVRLVDLSVRRLYDESLVLAIDFDCGTYFFRVPFVLFPQQIFCVPLQAGASQALVSLSLLALWSFYALQSLVLVHRLCAATGCGLLQEEHAPISEGSSACQDRVRSFCARLSSFDSRLARDSLENNKQVKFGLKLTAIAHAPYIPSEVFDISLCAFLGISQSV